MNGIRDVYRNNSINFVAAGLKLSEKINNFSTKFIDVRQKFADGYGFVAVTVRRTKKY